ncbi:thermonuclease family protein [Glutamicibacter sp. AOP12-B1-11]|uniref:thermonuclease family protein n=1 Tax=Glutamicibacter sp. AOP12-B1-11 TaxID=3457725 RepID=UPI0040335D0C
MSKKRTAWISIGVTAALVTGGAVYAGTLNSDSRGTVVRVIDGDTVDMRIAGEETRVRLLNIDTPETADPDKAVECMGPEASDYLKSLLAPGDKVKLEYDIERTDRYGRTLAGVYKDKSLISAEIAAAGLGIAVKYEPNVRFYDEVLRAEKEASTTTAGLFDPNAECTIPAKLDDATQALGQLGDAPADSINEAESLAGEAAAAIALGHGAKSALDKLTPNSHPVAYALLATHFAKNVANLDTSISRANGIEQAHQDHKTALIKAEEGRKEAEKKKKEEAAKKKKAAEEKAAEEQRRAAIERQQQAAEQKAAEQRRLQQQKPKPAAPKVQQPRPKTQQPRQQGPSNYTGPRCYAPGGKSWKPCP